MSTSANLFWTCPTMESTKTAQWRARKHPYDGEHKTPLRWRAQNTPTMKSTNTPTMESTKHPYNGEHKTPLQWRAQNTPTMERTKHPYNGEHKIPPMIPLSYGSLSKTRSHCIIQHTKITSHKFMKSKVSTIIKVKKTLSNQISNIIC